MADDVRLEVGGHAFTGWESVEITRSIEAVCASFRLSVLDAVLPGGGFPIQAGAACRVFIGRDLVLTGFVDAVESAAGSSEHTASVEGRSKAADLVDCCPVGLALEHNDIGLMDIARLLADQFALEVRLQLGADPGRPFQTFALHGQETAHEALDRACRQRGFLLQDDPAGVLVLTQAGDERAGWPIEEGRNFKSGTHRFDLKDRFARYLVRGQRPGSDTDDGADEAELEGEGRDPVPRGVRTLVISAETGCDDEQATAQAVWNASVRAARSEQLSVVLASWRQGFDRGPVWRPNLIVPVKLPIIRASGDWLVAGVKLAKNPREGTSCELGLVRPGSYLPEPPSAEDGGFGGDVAEGAE